jgi:hypothetical protein
LARLASQASPDPTLARQALRELDAEIGAKQALAAALRARLDQ